MATLFEAKDKVDFSQRLLKIVQCCGFESFVIGLELKAPNGGLVHHVTSTYPPLWRQLYDERQYAALDPTVRHCQASTEPMVWHEQIFFDADCMTLLEEAQSYGVSHGISVAVHERSGRKSMLSLARDKSLWHDPGEKNRLTAYARVLSSSMHVMATRLIFPEIGQPETPALTTQETQCLQWFAHGKTPWEIGEIMKISEATTAFYLENAMKKLGAVNRLQALAIAMDRGIVD